MDRHLVAYLLIAGLLVVAALCVARARYFSRDRVVRRRRQAEEACWAERMRERTDELRADD